jgi:hypothetical protein
MVDQGQAALEFLLQESQTLLSNSADKWSNGPPLPFESFVREHLKITLTERQLQDAQMLLGPDPEKVFDNGSPFNILCLIAGKGAGKDFLGAAFLVYCLYVLLCMKDPRSKECLDWPVSDAIDMLIVSFTAEQARDVSFDKVKQMVRNWAWLKMHYLIIDGDRMINPSNKGKPEILLLADQIKTWHNIRIKAEHSANESFEGYNVLVWIMSESSAFKGRNSKVQNGKKVYNTLRSSASSRFQNKWKGMVYSYLRENELTDFTWQLYNDSENDPTIYRDLCYPWQFKPAKYYSAHTFDFEGIQVPVIPYQDDATSNPEFFRMAYLCQIPRIGERAISAEVIEAAIHRHEPIITIENVVAPNMDGEMKVKAVIRGLEDPSRFMYDYLITVDLGEKYAATGIAIQHHDPRVGYVLDCVGAWTPIVATRKDEKSVPVDMDDVKERLIDFGLRIPGARIGFDQWQSILYASELNKRGIKTEMYHVQQVRDYKLFRQAMSAGIVWIPNDPEFVRQANAIVLDQNEVLLDTRISTRKDMFDAAVGGFKILMKPHEFRPEIPGAVYVTNNIASQGGFTIPDSI